MKLTIEIIKNFFQEDQKSRKQLTYMIPNRAFDDFVKDELLWVESTGDDFITVFRCMDGKRYNFYQKDLFKLSMTARG